MRRTLLFALALLLGLASLARAAFFGTAGTAVPAPPSVSLVATPTEIVSGSGDSRNWGSCTSAGDACLQVTVTGTTTSCTPTGFAMSGAASQNVPVNPSATTTYSLYCSNGSANSATASATVTVDPTGYFASPTGATASGACATTISTPYSITSVQKCAENSLKPIYVRGGTYNLTALGSDSCNLGYNGPATLNLTTADAGETWQDYPPDGIDTAVLNGQCTASGCNGTYYGKASAGGAGFIFCVGGGIGSASNPITFNGLKFENTRFADIYAVSPVHVENSEFTEVYFSGESAGGGAISLAAGAGGSTIEHNYIHDVAFLGIALLAGSGTPPSNVTINNNVLFDTCSNASDCGAIYAEDENSTAFTGLLVENNYIRDVFKIGGGDFITSALCSGGVASVGNMDSNCTGNGYVSTSVNGGYCLYADQEASNITWKGNLCTGLIPVGAIIHGGQNNVFYDNIFDIGQGSQPLLVYYQLLTGSDETLWASGGNMTGNDWQHNIVIENKAPWSTYAYTGGSGPNTPMRVTNNLYYAYAGSTNYLCYPPDTVHDINTICSPNLPGSTGVNGAVNQDSNPTVGNPLLSSCYGAWPQSGSPAFNASVAFPAMPAGWDTAGFWGPPGFQVSTLGTGDTYDSGTAPSWPVGGTCGSAG